MLQSQHSISLESSVFNEVDRSFCLTCYTDKLQIFSKIKLFKRYAGVLVGILNELQWCFFKGKKLNKLYYLWSCPPPLLCYTQTPVAMLLHRFVGTETEVVCTVAWKWSVQVILKWLHTIISALCQCRLRVSVKAGSTQCYSPTSVLQRFYHLFFPCVVENVIQSYNITADI